MNGIIAMLQRERDNLEIADSCPPRDEALAKITQALGLTMAAKIAVERMETPEKIAKRQLSALASTIRKHANPQGEKATPALQCLDRLIAEMFV